MEKGREEVEGGRGKWKRKGKGEGENGRGKGRGEVEGKDGRGRERGEKARKEGGFLNSLHIQQNTKQNCHQCRPITTMGSLVWE